MDKTRFLSGQRTSRGAAEVSTKSHVACHVTPESLKSAVRGCPMLFTTTMSKRTHEQMATATTEGVLLKEPQVRWRQW